MDREYAARHYHIDESRMIDNVMRIPDQVEEAWRFSQDFKPFDTSGISSLIICGMGGSAVGALLLKDIVRSETNIAIHLVRGYTLPAFAGENTPVICISYSGNTEEVLSVFRDARSRRCPVASITSGGALREESKRAGIPYLEVHGGLPPRAAIGYLFTPLLRIVSNCGICSVSDKEIETAVRKTRGLAAKYCPDGDPADNTALNLAKRLYGKIPLVYSGDGLLAGVAYRWKCQFNENSKTIAYANVFPELGHNEIMGWECPGRFRDDLFLIMLRDRENHPRLLHRMNVTYEMLEPLAGGAVMIDSEGAGGRSGRLARLFSVLILGDFASVYLAVEYGKDPTPIDKIEMIKKKLRSEDR